MLLAWTLFFLIGPSGDGMVYDLIIFLLNCFVVLLFVMLCFVRAEINIKPWSGALKDIKDGNERSEWKDRVPYAYWKGNPFVSPIRKDLMTCNVTDQNDWNARLYIQVKA